MAYLDNHELSKRLNGSEFILQFVVEEDQTPQSPALKMDGHDLTRREVRCASKEQLLLKTLAEQNIQSLANIQCLARYKCALPATDSG